MTFWAPNNPLQTKRFWNLYKQYPLFLLLIGPPVFRTIGSREADASLQGSFDFWIIWQIAFYVVVGVMSFNNWQVIRRQHKPPKLIRHMFIVIALLVLSLFASAIYSPSPLLTLAYSLLFAIGFFSALQFSFYIAYSPDDSIFFRLFSAARSIGLFLSILVYLAFFFGDNFVGFYIHNIGLRIMGGSIAPLAIISFVIFSITLSNFFYNKEKIITSIIYIIFSVAGILLAKTRSVYFVSLIVAMWFWFFSKNNTMKSWNFLKYAISFFLFPILFLLIIHNPNELIDLVTRGTMSTDVDSLVSGRLTIGNWVMHQISNNPFGLGYIAGFRDAFLQLHFTDSGLVASRIGNAHNSFLEMIAGGGWLSLSLFILLLLYSIVSLLKVYRKIARSNLSTNISYATNLTFIIMFSFIFLSFITSDFVIPARSSFGYFLFSLFIGPSILSQTDNH